MTKRRAIATLTRMEIIRSADALTACPGANFVPTMGALHRGHLSLVERARELSSGPVLVSIFVNPTQFAVGEDFDRYPRPLEDDLAQCRAASVDAVFVPDAEVIYPPGTPLSPPMLPDVAVHPKLEDACRPGHFAGVAQVVSRLFDLVRPATAIFGEKDFQQLRTIEDLVAAQPDRWPGLRIERGETVRESDGLAMSSRNRYLDPEARKAARGVFRALQSAAAAQHPETAMRRMHETLEVHGLTVDYAEIRDARTLMPVPNFEGPARALIAARLNGVRLIDNLPMPVWS